MAVLSTRARKNLAPGKFGIYREGKGSYPMPDASHAANAKARATQMANAGRLSESSKEKIDAKADRILGKK